VSTKNPLREVERVKEKIVKVERSLASRIGRGVMWTVLWIVLAVVALFGAFAWYTTTTDFERRVGRKVVSILEDATGGRVELRAIHFDLLHLAIDAQRLIIHGLEEPGEAPYLSVDRILIRVRLFNFLGHASGAGLASHVSLNFLRVEHPQIHLIVDKDGRTNQPVPKHPSTNKTPVMDTLLDLKAQQVEVVRGVALFNNHSVPFEAAARDLSAQIRYIPSSDRYGAVVELSDLRSKLRNQPEAQSRIHLEAEVGRNVAELTTIDVHTGQASQLHATGRLTDFANPDWEVNAKGSLEVRQIAVLTGLDSLKAGTVDLEANGHSCKTAPAEANPSKPHFWQRLRPGTKSKQGARSITPPPECVTGYLITGSAKIRGAGYRDQYVRLRDVDGSAKVHMTPSELLLTEMTGNLPGGGSASGDLRIASWLGPEPSHAYLTATLSRMPLRTIMDVTAPENYGDLGFDTAVSGPARVEWGGPAKSVADTVEVDGNLTLAPTGTTRGGARSNTPISGQVVAHYTGKDETVRIQRLTALTPGTSLEASGVLGVNTGDRLTALRTDLLVRNLAEFDQLLTTLGLEANGKRGAAAIPVSLHGALEFHGTASGPVRNLNVKGHVQGTQIEFAMGTTDALIDTLIADAEYSPNEGVVIAHSIIKRSATVLNVEGTLRPRREVSPRGVASYIWDEGMGIDAKAQLAEASVPDVLQIAGLQKVPVTGSIAADAHVTGTLDQMHGSGHVSLANGAIYGEPYESVVADLGVEGKEINASRAVAKLHGMQITGNGAYNLANEHLRGHVEGRDLALSKFETVKNARLNADARLSLIVDANGTLKEPGLKANAKLAQMSYDGHSLGDASAEAHTAGEVLYTTVDSTLVGAKVGLAGQVQLSGNFESQAKLTIASLDIDHVLAVVAPGSVVAQSSISGTATVNGPLKTPQHLSGTAEFDNVDLKLQGIELKAAEPLRVSLRDGIATLEQVHITGQDTNMQMSGTAQLFGANEPRGGRLNVRANGSVSMALLHTFDSDVVASGKTEFSIAANGQLMNPSLSGTVQFHNVNLSLDDLPNGLSDMNGTLMFNNDRLEVQTLTAKTGGGDLRLGGSIRFRNGIFADLTATGDAVRVRMFGLSTTANANLRLQGTPRSSLLSGNILITRFGVGQNVDFAAFAGPGGISTPPDPNAPSNRVRLDVRVTSSPQLDFLNSYARLSGSVDLTIRGTLASPSVLGRIQITDGSATFAGTKYQLQRGDIFFTNPVTINPIIDLDATAQVENYEITIGLHGTLDHLRPTYRSEPPLSEADIFALLALGRTQEEAQLYQARQVQAGTDPTTSALLGGALNATVSNRVEKLFGVGSVKIDPAFVGTLGNSSARVTVQEQVSKQITVTFATNVNTSAQQLIQVQYDLNHNNSIVITRDETGVFSIVYKLRKRYR
jgi:translocation and assembly module TamB